MIYSGFIVDENGRVKECARCSNEEIGEHDWYCKVCAAPVVNKCTSISYDFNGAIEWECGTIAAGNARYCTKCGSETVFFKNGLLEPWQNEKHDRERYDLEALFSE